MENQSSDVPGNPGSFDEWVVSQKAVNTIQGNRIEGKAWGDGVYGEEGEPPGGGAILRHNWFRMPSQNAIICDNSVEGGTGGDRCFGCGARVNLDDLAGTFPSFGRHLTAEVAADLYVARQTKREAS